MKKYVKPEIEIKNFQTSEDFAALTGADVFGAGNGSEEIPVSTFTYNAAASTVE